MLWAVIKISEHRGTIKVQDFNRGGELGGFLVHTDQIFSYSKYFPPFPYLLFFSSTDQIFSHTKYFPSLNIFLLCSSSPSLNKYFPSPNIALQELHSYTL